MNQIIIINKPKSISSHKTAEQVKLKHKAKKAGHSGTLDENATGILVVALDEATKLMPLLQKLDKKYEGVIHLHTDKPLAELKIPKGKITQIPPVRSAVARKPREREIYDFHIKKQGKDISFTIHCESGTYIRKIATDMGGHLKELHRTAIGPFNKPAEYTLEQLTKFFPSIEAPESAKNGAPFSSKGKDQLLLLTLKGKVIGLGKRTKNRIKVERIINL
jgi:tRNA U55 pseudouridine synthase TruB